MKKKLLFSVLLMLTVFTARSQDTTTDSQPQPRDLRPVSFPFWMVQEIALDLEDKQRLELEVELLVLENETWKRLVTGLEEKDQNRRLQMELLEKNQRLLEVQLLATKKNHFGKHWLVGILQLLGALGVGFLLGSI